MTADLLATVRGGEPELPDRPVPTAAALDLRHRFFRGLAGRVEREDELDELVVALLAELLESIEPKQADGGRPGTAIARRRAVAGAREALGEDPRTGVIELSRRVAVSPHHLSRVFKAETGETISPVPEPFARPSCARTARRGRALPRHGSPPTWDSPTTRT